MLDTGGTFNIFPCSSRVPQFFAEMLLFKPLPLCLKLFIWTALPGVWQHHSAVHSHLNCRGAKGSNPANEVEVTPPKSNSSICSWKMDGWKTIVSFLKWSFFRWYLFIFKGAKSLVDIFIVQLQLESKTLLSLKRHIWTYMVRVVNLGTPPIQLQSQLESWNRRA